MSRSYFVRGSWGLNATSTAIRSSGKTKSMAKADLSQIFFSLKSSPEKPFYGLAQDRNRLV